MSVTTLGEAKTIAIKLINNYSTSGNLITASDPNMLDYTLRMNGFFNTYQNQVATIKKIHALHKITQNPIPNQLPNPIYLFDVVQHLAADLTYTAKGSKAYYFEVDNLCDVYIEEEVSGAWVALPTPIHIEVTTKPDGFFAYKGLITAADDDNNIRIRFSGDYPYNIRGIALYAYTFPTDDDIPPYTRYNLYTMPADFYQLNKVVWKGNTADSKPYVNTADFFWEGRNVIAINYYNKGEYSIFYYKYPTKITDTTLDTATFDIDEDAVQCLAFLVAADVIQDERASIANTLRAIGQNMLANLDVKISNGSNSVANTMFTGDSSHKLV